MKSAASELTILSILNQIPGKIGNSLWTLWARGANSGTEFLRWEPLLINRKWMVIMPPGANSTEGGAKFNSCVKSHLDPVSRPHVGDVVEVGGSADHLRTSVRVPGKQSVSQFHLVRVIATGKAQSV